VPPGSGFFIDRLSIAQNLEATAARGGQLDLGVGESLANLGRQTGGPGFVVSKGAVFDLDLH
jgi:hypothetical protein